MTVVELAVALALLAIIAAVMAPAVLGRLRSSHEAVLANNLRSVTDALWSFRGDLGRFPRRLERLNTRPPLTAPFALDLCGRAIANAGAWAGPYLKREISPSGVQAGQFLIADSLRRVPATLAGGSIATMFIDVTDVDSATAANMERVFDGATLSYTTGAIRWETISGVGRLSFAITIRNC